MTKLEEAIKSNLFRLTLDGKIETLITTSGKISSKNIWRTTGSKTKKGYIDIKFRNRKIFVHRLSYALAYGLFDESMHINHIDGNKLNNHPYNLELVTRTENMKHAHDVLKICTQCKLPRSKSGFKGVYKAKNKWKVEISIRGKRKFLGLYSNPEKAALVYDRQAIKIHGSKAKTNF